MRQFLQYVFGVAGRRERAAIRTTLSAVRPSIDRLVADERGYLVRQLDSVLSDPAYHGDASSINVGGPAFGDPASVALGALERLTTWTCYQQRALLHHVARQHVQQALDAARAYLEPTVGSAGAPPLLQLRQASAAAALAVAATAAIDQLRSAVAVLEHLRVPLPRPADAARAMVQRSEISALARELQIRAMRQ